MRKNNKINKVAKKFSNILKTRLTKAERHFKQAISRTGITCTPQKIIYNSRSFYIIDFFLPNKNLYKTLFWHKF